jgi:hypothetical protein
MMGPAGLQGEGSFYKVLSLPVGATLDRFRVSFSADDIGFDWCTTIVRVKAGEDSADVMSYGRLDVPDLPAMPFTTVEGFIEGNVSRRVAAGYRYYLDVHPVNTKGKLYSVQVFYHR